MKLQQLFSLWFTLIFTSFLSRNGKSLESSKMWGNVIESCALHIHIHHNFSNCSVYLKSETEVWGRMCLSFWWGSREEHDEGPSNLNRKETPNFCATEISVPLSPSPFCCIINLRNIILPGMSSQQTFFS